MGGPRRVVGFRPVVPSHLTDLNAAQLEAVSHTGGPLLVLAGAGSGKTRVLTRRIAHLVWEGMVEPHQVLAITFTNKAAEEMRQRVQELVGDVAKRMWVSTFHSACVRILRRDAPRIGYPSTFSIYDQTDSVRLCSHVLVDMGVDTKRLNPRGIHAAISAAKNEMLSPDDLQQRARDEFSRTVARVYEEYQLRLRQAGAMDFDDLLVKTVELLRSDEQLLEDYRDRFRHVLVDEYQDTNPVQNTLVVLLAERDRNVTVVGDHDQSIYGFRGADIRNILEFERVFPDCTVIVLEQNYRSTQTILDAANSVISNNPAMRPKRLWTPSGAGPPILVVRAADEREEAAFIVRRLLELREREGLSWADAAVFYRINAQSRAVEEAFVSEGIPYQVVGGTRFYDRREIRDALAYLRVAVNPADEVSLRRIMNTPKRGIGEKSINQMSEWSSESGVSLWEGLLHAEQAGVTGRALAGVGELVRLVELLRSKLGDGPSVVIRTALEESGYLDELRSERTLEAEGRLENLEELLSAAAEIVTVAEFLEQVSLVSDVDEMRDEDAVTLMTLHSAKGLEFPVVFMIGMEEGLFPHSRALGDERELEEERRLCYVGITRAMKWLHLSHARSRVIHGATQFNPPSRFLDEIPAHLVEEVSGLRSRTFVSAGRRVWRQSVSGRSALRDAESSALPSLRPGDDVRHEKFGEGVVLSVEGVGEKTEVVVNFPEVGAKRLLLSLAPMEKIPSAGSVEGEA